MLVSRFKSPFPISGRTVPVVTASVHLLALVLMAATEVDAVGCVVFFAVWLLLNSILLVAPRRPLIAALLSLECLVILSLLSRFKFDKLWMTIDFVDVAIVDQDTVAFLLATFPQLRWLVLLMAVATIAATAGAWRWDRIRVRRRIALAGLATSGLLLGTVSLLLPTGLGEDFENYRFVSKFARTGIETLYELTQHGYLDAAERGPLLRDAATDCAPTGRRPNIILLHDESSFDITIIPGVAVPEGYHRHFQSFDGRARKLLVEGVGGPSWFTEYNVLTGLSVRSFRHFATSVTRIAAGHIHRGLPLALRDCGYQTFSLYPFHGSFLGSRAFQTGAGIAHYLDMNDLGTTGFEADSFYFNRAVDLISRARDSGPLFLYVYTVANHFPWGERLRPELTPGWQDLGNTPDIEEYIRRQTMSAADYAAFLQRLKQEFPTESFLIIRYGDHLPPFAPRLVSAASHDGPAEWNGGGINPRLLTTYYAIDAVNFVPVDSAPAEDLLDAPYLPLVALRAAGLPLDASFSEQNAILQVCHGLFFRCEMGKQASRFNRLLIDAGLIDGLMTTPRPGTGVAGAPAPKRAGAN